MSCLPFASLATATTLSAFSIASLASQSVTFSVVTCYHCWFLYVRCGVQVQCICICMLDWHILKNHTTNQNIWNSRQTDNCPCLFPLSSGLLSGSEIPDCCPY